MANRKAGIFFNAAAFILLEAAALWTINTNDNRFGGWIGEWTTNIMATVWRPFNAISEYTSLRSVNLKLATENAELFEQLQSACDTLSSDEDMWRSSGGFEFEYLPATVVSQSHNTQHNYMILDRGWSDDVQERDGVITPYGVIGIIRNTSTNFSYAITFTNKNMSVSAKIGHEGHVGNLAWAGSKSTEAVLTGIPLHARHEVGDTVYTSGYSSMFPADIALGIITGSKTNANSTEDIEVSLFEDSDRVRYVMIVKNIDKEELEELLNE